jgi:hypothetical protein
MTPPDWTPQPAPRREHAPPVTAARATFPAVPPVWVWALGLAVGLLDLALRLAGVDTGAILLSLWGAL